MSDVGKLIQRVLFSVNFIIFIIIQHLYRILIIIYTVWVGSVQQNDRFASRNVFFFFNSKSCSDIFRVCNIFNIYMLETVFHGIRTFHHIILSLNVSNLGVSLKFFKIVFNTKPHYSPPTFLGKSNWIKDNFKDGTITIPIELVLSWKSQLMLSCMVVLKCMRGKPEHKLRLFSISCGDGK